MSVTDGQITRQGSSYRQGLVLGLTMAEIMLLLVFCLLIAMAAFLRKEQVKREEANKKVEQLSVDNQRNQDLLEALRNNETLVEKLRTLTGTGDPEAIDKYWRELIDSRATADELQKSGLSLKEVRDRIAEIKALRANGIDVDKAIKDANAMAAIKRAMVKSGEPPASTQVILDALARSAPGSNSSGHQWPPMISLSEAEGYFFKSGSAELTPEFRDKLLNKVPDVQKLIDQYDVDVVEVVGHTDEQPLGARPSNLDWNLASVLKNTANVGSLVPADNAGLGLARAVSVVSVLRQSPLIKYKLIPLSGAQLVNTDETLAIQGIPANIKERRRIEIRLRKSDVREIATSAAPPLMPPSPKRRPTAKPAPLSLLPKQSAPPQTWSTPAN
ncbi:flagellar motor protein MotB [Bradyrhizobium sp. USDA 4532]|uniref:hypothetical protein n=1 Tax=unclassified Bradyrhizobium TaxID=2631580 RepID=UPI00209C7097|nr:MULTISPECIES: hypothetical protein [unclassified Bradyrhizobium]MCP1830703.1 flagellar motor protein MotB [Bradyrhizobium sp. USDA 4545]MCP1923812.1 flagellar motor protein MotB [Bradyrhizobium sp. USDA 4532]